MKKYLFLGFWFCGVLYAGEVVVSQSAFLVDAIQAVVFGGEEPQIITYSEVVRPSLSGEPRSLEDLIFERQVAAQAKELKIMEDEDAVDKYLLMVQKQNNMTLDDIKNVFSSAGMSYEEGREELKRMQMVNTMIDFKIRTQVVVPRKQVEQYYEEHLVVTEAKVTAQRGFIPYAEDKLAQQKKALVYMAQTGREMRGMQWGKPVELSEAEVADDKEFLFALKKGEISTAKDVGIGFEVFRAVDTSPRIQASLEERYKEIADMLRKPIFEELLDKYKKSLMETSSVLYLQPITGAAAPTV